MAPWAGGPKLGAAPIWEQGEEGEREGESSGARPRLTLDSPCSQSCGRRSGITWVSGKVSSMHGFIILSHQGSTSNNNRDLALTTHNTLRFCHYLLFLSL
jgi:hypothetical protein